MGRCRRWKVFQPAQRRMHGTSSHWELFSRYQPARRRATRRAWSMVGRCLPRSRCECVSDAVQRESRGRRIPLVARLSQTRSRDSSPASPSVVEATGPAVLAHFEPHLGDRRSIILGARCVRCTARSHETERLGRGDDDDDDDDGGGGGDCKRGDGGGDGGGDQSIGGFEFTRNIAHTNWLAAAVSGTRRTRAPGFRFPMTSG